jgi:hypothetical protein
MQIVTIPSDVIKIKSVKNILNEMDEKGFVINTVNDTEWTFKAFTYDIPFFNSTEEACNYYYEAQAIPHFKRASKSCICSICGKSYSKHTLYKDGVLNVLCDGTLVKL